MDINVQKQEKYLIVIFGAPASGKTYFSDRLYQKVQDKMKSKLISADCFEQFLRQRSTQSLLQFIKSSENWDQVLKQQFKLKKNQFNQEIWKISRNFIKDHCQEIMKETQLLIIEDDMLLKSQRKNFRRIAYQNNWNYCQILIQSTIDECIYNNSQRNLDLNLKYQIDETVIRSCFTKLEKQVHANAYELSKLKMEEIDYDWIQLYCKKVKIQQTEHNSEPISQECRQKDQSENQIRKFIGQIIKNEELASFYFPGYPKGEIAIQLSKLKKAYNSKSKSLEQFKSLILQTVKNNK